MTLGDPDEGADEGEEGETSDETLAGAIVQLVTSDVAGWRLFAGLAALVWTHRPRAAVPLAAVGGAVLLGREVAAGLGR